MSPFAITFLVVIITAVFGATGIWAWVIDSRPEFSDVQAGALYEELKTGIKADIEHIDTRLGNLDAQIISRPRTAKVMPMGGGISVPVPPTGFAPLTQDEVGRIRGFLAELDS